MSAPQPLTGPECDLRDFPYMKLEVRRLLTSETWIEAADDPKLGHALFSLWCESWHQVPAASLPDKDRTLARLAMCNADEWERVRGRALEGWVRCADGRLYHPVVAEKALEAMLEKLSHRRLSEAGNAKRWGIAPEHAATDAQLAKVRSQLAALNPQSRTHTRRHPARTNTGNAADTPTGIPPGIATGLPQGSQERGRGREKERVIEQTGAAAPSGPPSPEDRFWSRLEGLGWKGIGRSRCAQLLKLTSNDFVEANRILDGAEAAKSPGNYLGGVIRRLEQAPQSAPPGANSNVPPWVNQQRLGGIVVDAAGPNRWRCLGETLNDAGEVVGF